jgi:o-succinylbenzoate---CoA ligase
MPAGPAFVDALRRIWADGDAVLPVDQRLPPAARDRLYAELRPRWVDGAEGRSPAPAADGAVREGDALVVATSGTTGAPKGVVLTHDAVQASALASSARLGVEPERDRWLACLPLSHVGGLSVVTRALVTGTPVEVHPGFDPAAVLAAAAGGASLTSLVPAALARVDVTAFRTVLLGGSAIPADRPANSVATYGMTETGSGVAYDGRPLDGVELRIDGDGAILARAPMLLRAYRSCDGEHDPRDADGWFLTGDGGEWLADGRLAVRGRTAEVIVTGGEKVWPGPVEDRLRAHPLVTDAAVLGVTDPDWGQQVVAWIETDDELQLGEMRDWVSEALPRWCAPKALHILPPGGLPRAALGKIDRAGLRARMDQGDR